MKTKKLKLKHINPAVLKQQGFLYRKNIFRKIFVETLQKQLDML